MDNTECNVFYARNLSELFYHIKTIANLKIVGACTTLNALPKKTISTTNIPELKQITKHERFIEFGPGATLSDILTLGERHLPKILTTAIKTIANPFIRNIATIGGNILYEKQKLTLYSPLMAFDTILEFKSPSETKNIPLSTFEAIPQDYVLTKIRVPLNDWDISLFFRLGPENKITDTSATYTFLVDTEKGIVNNIKIAFAGKITFRAQELENRLLGLRLPLSSKDIDFYLAEAELQFNKESEGITFKPIIKQQYLNLIRHSIEQLT